uniref:Rust transferred protein 1 n=1 Tax=Gymnosporangium sabinae TaxID=190632 RepID=I1U7E0_9BASI|nr:rust transferred protein 1 [Gymnosporangium sabinae]
MLSRKVFMAIGAAASIPFSIIAEKVEVSEVTVDQLAHQSARTATPFDMKILQSKSLIESYPLGLKEDAPMVFIYGPRPNSIAKRSLEPNSTDHPASPEAVSKKPNRPANETTVDMTPAKCTSTVCYSGSFQPPDKPDCDVIVAAQLYNSTGSLTAYPEFVYVTYGTCAVVFQNPTKNSNFALQYNWALLGNIIIDLEGRCFRKDSESIGGACRFDHYLSYHFKNVISLQRIFPDKDASKKSSKD